MAVVTVSELKQLVLANLSLEIKVEVKLNGRPNPMLNIVQVTKTKNRDFKRVFNPNIYENTPWICGCEETNRLYCFPCLLFAKQTCEPSWVKFGVADLVHLQSKIKKHEVSQAHINSVIELNLLGKVDIRQTLDSAYKQNIRRHNERVTNNRYVLSKLIDCINFCGAFELALRGHREDEQSSNPGIFRGLVNFSAELNVALKDHLESATVFKGTSKNIQNELLDCMLAVCHDHIKQEIKTASFVSLIADETTDVSALFQLVIVFRYILPDGRPVERFWEFVQPTGHDADSIAKCLKNALETVVNAPEKLISQSYDGASVMSGHHAGVQTLIKELYPNAFYVHCYAHQLNLVIAQATAQNQQVRIFFSDLSDLTNFFSNSPQRVAVLDKVVSSRIPRASTTRWNFKSRTVNTVYEHREDLIVCMEEIENTSRQTTTISKAGAIRRMLGDPKFIFWLTVFHNIMPHVDILYKQLQLTYTDAVRIKKHVSTFIESINKERENMESVNTDVDETSFPRQKRARLSENIHQTTTVAAKEVCDVISNQIKERYSFLTHHSALSLLDCKQFKEYDKVFPVKLLEETVGVYSFLEKERLKTELSVMYKREDFQQLNGAVSLLQFVIENNLQTSLSEAHKLMNIISTIPMTTAEAERCFSSLKRIKTFLRSTMSQERLTSLAMLSVEKQMIRDIPNFKEKVIDVFAKQKERRMDFVYKTST